MGKLLDEIGPAETEFVAKQKVFFVATAPLDQDHHVNLSPKAPGSSLIVLGPKKVAYADLCGSGCETAAHVMENGRMTIMFCNLEEGAPKILRFHGKAEVIVKENVEESLLQKFPDSITQSPGFRSIFVLTVERVSSSCGYSLPIMTYQKTRSTLHEYTDRKGLEGMNDYCLYNNSFSIDGLASVAQLRFRDKIIVPKPEEGFVHGAVAGSTPEGQRKLVSYHQPVKSISKTRDAFLASFLQGVMIFVTGVVVGFWVIPHLLGPAQIELHSNSSTAQVMEF